MARAVDNRKAKNTIKNTLGGLFVQAIWISCVAYLCKPFGSVVWTLKLEPVML